MTQTLVDAAALIEPRLLVPHKYDSGIDVLLNRHLLTTDKTHPLGKHCTLFFHRDIDIVSKTRVYAGSPSSRFPGAWTGVTQAVVTVPQVLSTDITVIVETYLGSGHDNNEGITLNNTSSVLYNTIGWIYYTNTGRWNLQKPSTNNTVISGTCTVGTWHWTALTGTCGTGGTVETYDFGLYTNSASLSGTAWTVPVQTITINATPANEENLRNLVIFNRKLSPAEIMSMYRDMYQFLTPA
jgi:hypothetical protein